MPQSVVSDAYKTVVEYLVELRKRQGVTQVELARRLGRTQQFVSFIETRERRLDVVEFYAYVRALGVDPTEVIAKLYQGIPPDVRL